MTSCCSTKYTPSLLEEGTEWGMRDKGSRLGWWVGWEVGVANCTCKVRVVAVVRARAQARTPTPTLL